MLPKQAKKPTTKASSNVAKPNHTQEKAKQSDLLIRSTAGKITSSKASSSANMAKPSRLQERKQNPDQPKIPLKSNDLQEEEQNIKQPDLPFPKIRSKAMFRTVKLTSLDQAKQIRVKFWKLKSYHLGKNPFTSTRVIFKMHPGYDEDDDKYKPILQYFFGATLKKSLKFTKRLEFINQKDVSLSNFKKLFILMSKVEKLALPIDKFCQSSRTFLKNYLSPQTTQLTLHLTFPLSPQNSLVQDITFLKRLRRCESIIKMPESPEMEMMKLKSPIKSRKSNEKTLFDRMIKTVSKSLEEISIEDCHLSLQSKKALVSQKNGLQNLKKLRLIVGTGKPTDISFIENSPNLHALAVKIWNTKIASFDFLTRLSQLQELSIISREYPSTFQLPDLPPITTLKKLTIVLQKSTFNLQNIQKTIAGSKNLEALHLILGFKEILLLLQHEIKLPFLQELTLRDLDTPSDEAYPSLAFQKILTRYKHVARLTMDLGFSFSIAKSLEQLTNLTHLSISNSHLFKEKPKQLVPLKGLFTTLKALQSLQINLLDSWLGSQDLITLAGDLSFLKNLQCLEFRVYFKKNWSEGALNKLANFLKSFQNLKRVNIKVSGFEGEKHFTIIGSTIIQDLKLWEKVDYFDLYPIPELHL